MSRRKPASQRPVDAGGRLAFAAEDNSSDGRRGDDDTQQAGWDITSHHNTTQHNNATHPTDSGLSANTQPDKRSTASRDTRESQRERISEEGDSCGATVAVERSVHRSAVGSDECSRTLARKQMKSIGSNELSELSQHLIRIRADTQTSSGSLSKQQRSKSNNDQSIVVRCI